MAGAAEGEGEGEGRRRAATTARASLEVRTIGGAYSCKKKKKESLLQSSQVIGSGAQSPSFFVRRPRGVFPTEKNVSSHISPFLKQCSVSNNSIIAQRERIFPPLLLFHNSFVLGAGQQKKLDRVPRWKGGIIIKKRDFFMR